MMLPRKVNHFRGNSLYLDQNTLWIIGYFAHSNRVFDTNLDYHAQNTPLPGEEMGFYKGVSKIQCAYLSDRRFANRRSSRHSSKIIQQPYVLPTTIL